MDRLECSELLLSELKEDNEKIRIDSDFFNKNYREAYKFIKSLDHVSFNEGIEFLTDFHSNGSYENIANNFQLLDEEDYAYMVRTTDLEKRNYTENVKYVSEDSYNFLQKTKLFGGELLINKIGSPGEVFYMPHLNRPASLGMNLFMIRTNQAIFLEEFLYLFFKSNVGKLIIKRKVNGTVPLTIDKEAIKSLPIPYFSMPLQLEIKDLVLESFKLMEESARIYREVELDLLKYLELDYISKETSNISVESSETIFKDDYRIDSEYFQPKYTELLSLISQKPHMKLSDLATIKKSIEPGSEAYTEYGIPFIRVSNLTKFGLSKTDIFLDFDEFSGLNLFPSKNTILLSKDGTIGIAYKVEEDLNMITSGAILHLNVYSHKILEDYLTLVLNSLIVKYQAEKQSGGSIIKHWKKTDIDNVLIPILPIEIQEMFTIRIKKSFELRKKSERLLEQGIKMIDNELIDLL